MIGRAMLGRPWLFAQAAAALRGLPVPARPTIDEQRQLLLDHYDAIVEQFGVGKGTVLMRKIACCYAQGCPGARSFRDHVARVSTPECFRRVVSACFPRQTGERPDHSGTDS